MGGLYVDLIALKIAISVIGVTGNMVLIMSIFKSEHVKTFEILLLALAAANLEEIVIGNVYDVLRLSDRIGVWSCRTLKFLTMFGTTGSILFTVLISIYRYQKLRDVHTHVSLHIFMDNIQNAVGMTAFCATLATILSVPTLFISLNRDDANSTSLGCPADFFQCTQFKCPTQNRIYKYSFLLVCNLLPLLIVTLTSIMILRILIVQQKTVKALQEPSVAVTQHHQQQQQHRHWHGVSGFHRSTLAILAAMALFQVDWIVYLILHLVYSNPYSFPAWSEVEFLITVFYTALSPYVYGLGNDLFNIKRCIS
ncbi:uncharacterized protein ora6 [Misgurnus anguillicaudatus]|uniref:uncharacterized protein ora6 n=1 Tax=Misgurnus anguillicaudatus TaxID=75329 RepID=UPI003CCF1C39